MDSNWTSPTDCASSVCNPHDTSVGCCQAVKISRTQPVSLTSWHVPLSLETEKKIRRTHGRRPSPFGRAQPTPAASVHVAAMSAAAAIARASITAATRAGTDCKPARRLTGNQQPSLGRRVDAPRDGRCVAHRRGRTDPAAVGGRIIRFIARLKTIAKISYCACCCGGRDERGTPRCYKKLSQQYGRVRGGLRGTRFNVARGTRWQAGSLNCLVPRSRSPPPGPRRPAGPPTSGCPPSWCARRPVPG